MLICLLLRFQFQWSQLKNFGYEFIETNNNSDFSLYILDGLTSQKGFDLELADSAFKTIETSIKTKNELSKTLKELHSERISLESEITQASKQTRLAEQLESKGIQEINTPPKKIVRDTK